MVQRTVVVLVALALVAAASPAVGIEVGQKAPDFNLPSTTGKNLTLGQFQGAKIVLLEFYVSELSPTCSANLSTRKVDYDKFQELGVQILGIGAGSTLSQQALADSLKLPYPLLSDSPELKVTRDYGVLAPAGTHARRAFFLIDRNRVVHGKWIIAGHEVLPSETILKAARDLVGK